MSQIHEQHKPANPYIDTIWQSRATADGTYLVTPDGSWDLIAAIKANGERVVFITGQVTKPTRLAYKAGERSVVISFAAGVYLTHLKGAPLTDSFIMLPLVDNGHFTLAGHVFPFPVYENAEEIVEEMIRLDILTHDAIVDSMLRDTPKAASQRSVQRHFKVTTGLTQKKLNDIRRAQQAVRLLKEGVDPSTTAANTGYYDQPHLTKSLKRLMDSSPSNVDDINQV